MGEKDGVEMRYSSPSCLEFRVPREVVEGYDFCISLEREKAIFLSYNRKKLTFLVQNRC